MTIDQIIREIVEMNDFNKDWELCWWMCCHCSEF